MGVDSLRGKFAGNGAKVATLFTALSAALLPLSAGSVGELADKVVLTVSTVCNDFVWLRSHND